MRLHREPGWWTAFLALLAFLQIAVAGAIIYEHAHPPKPLHERALK